MSKAKDKISTDAGEFVGVRITRNSITLWVEGKDSDAPAVAGTCLNALAARRIALRLNVQADTLERWPDHRARSKAVR